MKINVMYDFREEEYVQVKHTLWQKVVASLGQVTASHEEQISPLTILVLF